MADLPDWPYWKVVSITGQSGAGEDYQVELEIGDSAGGDFHLEGHCTNFPQDIRITDDDGITLLDHWVEDLTADPIVVTVKVDDDLGSNQDIRVYYGKSGETTASSISTTFIESEDFESGNVNDWTVESGVAFGVDSSVKKSGSYSGKMGNGAINFNAAYLPIGPYTSDFIIEFDARLDGSNNARYWTLEKVASDYNNAVYVLYDSVDSRLESYNGTTYDVIGNISLNVWTKITYKVHPSSDTFDCLIDDAQETTANGARGDLSTTSAFTLMEGDSGYNHWVDNIRIRKYNSPEPAFNSAGAEQTPPAPTVKPMWYYDMLKRRNR